jgi:uncharacterized protein (TIGR02145 family)
MRTKLSVRAENFQLQLARRIIRPLLAAALGLAMTFTLSCSSGGDGDAYGGKGNNISNYRTKRIGNQVWMAENLNYAVEGSKCCGEGGQVTYYDKEGKNPTYTTLSNAEIQANCNKYGRLYDWATAMALPSNCNSSSCASQIRAKHRGICPSGWHIPSYAELGALMQFVNPGCSLSLTDYCENAGTKLKATSGWNDYDGKSGNGTDEFGFAALPGGGGYSDGDFGYGFVDVGYRGFWWSATEGPEGRDKDAYDQRMYSYDEGFEMDPDDKVVLFSVRCVKD